MDIKQIKQIIELMKRSELTEFAVEDEGFKLKIRRGGPGLPVVSQGAVSAPPFSVAAEAPDQAAPPAPAPSEAPKEEETDVTYIRSPMVGTFYTSASPESGPFSEIGANVTDTTVVCIIEAMKIMNEIQAENKGTIVEILVENGQPVEYGQPIFKLKQS
ncbi:MAG: acetyl-CoA carboxylase, biotin carboxyl carrier protein [Opitutaceae bacterium]|nr:acetyl-CoA carboxylase, biotin carboxyl carrier protein [Opitutaceae bacterium]